MKPSTGFPAGAAGVGGWGLDRGTGAQGLGQDGTQTLVGKSRQESITMRASGEFSWEFVRNAAS